FVAMEFVEGATLGDWQRAQDRSWRELVEMYVQAARGLHAAHVAGLVHRDFKPDNVLVSRSGQAKVTDFGLVRAIGRGRAPRRRCIDPRRRSAARGLRRRRQHGQDR
ncbi:MAG: protein kinase, partial [Myxococcales bacterium]|nr:protein kinase [Myxococcales bacterium]